nr:winged helix-turn-helix domain-containing protein [Pectobacterium colocasium]
MRSTQIKALASEPRLEILRLLKHPQQHFSGQTSADPQEFGVCITLIADALHIAQPTASRHVDSIAAGRLHYDKTLPEMDVLPEK